MYGASWCWWCAEAEEFLKKNHIAYVKKDIENPDHYQSLKNTAKKLKYTRSIDIVPMFVIEDKMIPGFQPLEVLFALGRNEGIVNLLMTDKEQKVNFCSSIVPR
jgi:glutaredoxin